MMGGWGWGMSLLGGLGMLLFWGLIVVLVVWLVVTLTRLSQSGASRSAQPDSALDIDSIPTARRHDKRRPAGRECAIWRGAQG